MAEERSTERPTLEQAIKKAKVVGAAVPPIRTVIYRSLFGAEEPTEWANTVNETMAELRAPPPAQPVLNERGLPAEWAATYSTQKNGPWGQPLPKEAKGWTSLGTPDFGPGLQGFMRQLRYNFFEKDRPEPLQLPQQALDALEPVRQNLAALFSLGHQDLETQTSQAGPLLGQFGQSLLGAAVGLAKTSWEAGEQIPVFGQLARFSGAVVQTVLQAAMQPALAVEREAVGPTLLASDELIRRSYARQGKPVPEWHEWFRKLGPLAVIPVQLETGLAILRGQATFEEYAELRRANQESARIAYSAWRDPALREEFVRRIEAGEDPRLLAMELENPGAEALGQAIYDPLNLLDLVTSGAAKVARVTEATRRVSTMVPDVAKALDNVGAAVGDNAISQANLTLLDAVQRSSQAARTGILEEAAKRGLLDLDAPSKLATRSETTNNFLQVLIARSGNDPDSLFDAVKAIAYLNDPDLARVQEGLGILNRIGLSPEVALSQSGLESGVFLRTLSIDDAGNFNPGRIGRIIEQAEGDPAKLADLLGRDLDNALKEVFPTVKEHAALRNEYLAIEDEAERAAFLAKNPIAGQELSQLQTALQPVHEAMQKWVYQPAANLQRVLFLENPIYVMHNRYGNFMPALVDVGPKVAANALFGVSPVKALDNINTMLGAVSEAAIRGLGAAGSVPGGKIGTEGLLRRFSGKFGTVKAAQEEAGVAAHVVEKSVRDTMANALTPSRALSGLENVVGLSDEQRAFLQAVSRDNWGNAKAAVNQLRERGGASVVDNLSFLTDEQVQELRDLRLYDEALKRVREAESQEKAVAALDDLVRERSNVGLGAANEPPMVLPTDEFARTGQEAAHAISQNLSDEQADIFMRRVHESRETIRQFEEYGHEIGEMARVQINAAFIREAQTHGRTVEDGLKAAEEAMKRITEPVRANVRGATDDAFRQADVFLGRKKPPSGTWGMSEASRNLPTDHPLLRKMWRERQLGDIPENLSADAFRNALWDNYREVQNQRYIQLREYVVSQHDNSGQLLAGMAGIDANTPLRQVAETQLTRARMMDQAELVDGVATVSAQTTLQSSFLRQYQTLFGEGAEPTKAAGFVERLRTADPEGVIRILGDADLDQAAKAAAAEAGMEAEEFTARMFDEVLSRPQEVPLVSSADDGFPSVNRFFHESQPAAERAIENLKQGLSDNWGGRVPPLGPDVERQLAGWVKQVGGRMDEVRAKAIAIAQATRDAILHDYGKRIGLDLVASYIYPYQFWHSRTYLRWMKRALAHPSLVANYARYRHTLEVEHAGLPDWWKYSLNVSDLLGLDTKAPIWFNLEASLNPLNGLTGVDFTDPRRRLDWWGRTLEDIQKFGPSTWLPYQLLLALKYHSEGQEDAAARWAGRLYSPTRIFRDVTALMDPQGLGIELDPFVNYFGGGMDPWERPRVARQIGAMIDEENYPAAQIVDAAYNQEGQIWDEARARAINIRAPNLFAVAAPFFLGTGFKMRTEEDVQIDRFYNEMFGLMLKKPDYSPDEYRKAWSDLEAAYPFMDALLMAKKSGLDRDEAFAWNILDRIPPGMTSEMAERVGITSETISAFRESKGDFTKMSEAERLKFMGAVLDLGALLDVPDSATSAEWNAAQSLYGQMRTQVEKQFGEDIWELVDYYFGARDPDRPEIGDAILKQHPQIDEALDWQQQIVQMTPLLGAYYTSAERIRGYYKGEMYEAAARLFGDDLWDHFEVYYQLRDIDSKAAKQYWKDHPQLEQYGAFKSQEEPAIEIRVSKAALLLPDAAPAIFREGMEPVEEMEITDPTAKREVWIAEQIAKYATPGAGPQAKPAPEALEDLRKIMGDQMYRLWLDAVRGGEPTPFVQRQQRSPQEWQSTLGGSLWNLLLDYQSGEQMPPAAIDRLETLAERLGFPDWRALVDAVQ